ncbi:hypothetical protein Cni_G06930 [Canna indica]|uniref:Uncharacterized protein n=1 Tax=Canna indica TaxID=4628 RepID=A0AAQ3Q4G2_9LILI|nr:hypothetical protein Cni_G06930 [Canna indica]
MASPETEKGRARVGMPFSRLPSFAIFVLLLVLLFTPFSTGDSRLSSGRRPLQVENNFISFLLLNFYSECLGPELQHGLGMWRRFVAEFPLAKNATTHNITFVLAAHKTYRRDPLNGYQRYPGGWNISFQHYWAVSTSSSRFLHLFSLILVELGIIYLIFSYLQSVGFTTIPLFTIVIAWYVGFGLVLLLMCCCYCCCRRQKHFYSPVAYAMSLILLILLTVAAM